MGVNFMHAADYSLIASPVCMYVNDGVDLHPCVSYRRLMAVFYLTMLNKSLELRPH